MKRAVFVGIVSLGMAIALLAAAQQPKRRPPPSKASAVEAGAPKTDISLKDSRDAGGAVLEQKAGDGGARVFRFGEVEVEGRLKSPQIVYFLRRVRAEFSAGDLGHRPFLRELSETRNEPGF